jgi:hypothetical protein
VASGWLWWNLALVLTLNLIPTAFICLEFLACEQVCCSPGLEGPGRCGRSGERFVSGFERMRARQLAKAGRSTDSAMSPGALLRVHIPRGVPFVRDDRTGCLCAASLIAPRSILFGPRVMRMGV